MMPNLVGKSDQKGFTLVEVIVTIIATAILGVIFINFMGTAMSKSVRAVEIVQGEASAEAVLERIIADYVLKMNQNNATALVLIKTDIDNKSVYGNNVTAVYIIFDSGGNEAADTAGLNRTLKVTVAAAGRCNGIRLYPSGTQQLFCDIQGQFRPSNLRRRLGQFGFTI
jgi:prepilin-type N-terminal cleavage/methylation domain-containing protein